MTPSEFLGQVLGDDGYYCLVGITQGAPTKQKFYKTRRELLHAAQTMDANGINAYFALATLGEEGNRKADNAHQMRALFLDLDCGPSKPFADQQEAVLALKGFCKATSMPQPLVVGSGRGVHVYWPLTEPVPPADWIGVAKALKRACAAEGLEADPAVTADVARILRVPGTHNHKDGDPKPVEVFFGTPRPMDLERFREILGGYADRITEAPSDGLFVPKPVRLPGISTDTLERLQGNTRSSFKRIAQRTMKGDGCGQIKYILENVETLDEPMWRAGLSIAKHCDDAENAAAKISERHADYSPRETAKKMASIVGPYTCDSFANLNPDGCKGCPHFGKVRSPITLGREVVAAEPEDNVVEVPPSKPGKEREIIEIPAYPAPFFRGKTGGVYLEQKADDPDELPVHVMVYANDLYFTRRVFDHTMGEMVLGKLHLPNDSVRAFTLALTNLSSREKLREALSYQGVVATHPKNWDTIMSYTNTWVSHLQSTTPATDARRQFGWTDDDFTSFVIGDREIFGDRIEFNPPSTVTTPHLPTFEKRGTLEGWIEQAEFYNRSGMEVFQFKIGHTLGSPLMRFFPFNAAGFAMYSDGSGHGKTTTQMFALTAFGDPGTMMLRKNDTLNAKFNRLELYKDLPAEVDEVTNMTAESLSELVYDAYSGMQRNRLTSGSNAERVRGVPWKLCLGMSSNVSPMSRIMENKAAPQAELQRMLEYHVLPFKFASKAETDDFSRTVGHHVGHVVEPYIQYIINNKDEVAAMLAAVQADIDKRADLAAKNRYWSVTVAVSIVSLVICKKLGFLNYDIKAVTNWALEMLKLNKMRDAEMTMNVKNIVNEYVTDNYSNLLWIKSTQDMRIGGTSGAKGIDSLVVPEHEPRGKLVGRYETDLKLLYLMPKALRQWCSAQQLNYDSVVKNMMEEMKGERRKARISKGTKLNLPPTDVIIVDCSDLGIEAPAETGDGGSEA